MNAALATMPEASNLRLVNIITHANQGGAQEAIVRVSRELRRRGHEVEIWFLYGDSSGSPSDIPARTLLPCSNPGPAGYLRILTRLPPMLRAAQPDGVIAFLPLACAIGLSAACLARVRARVASQRNPYWTYSPFMQLCDKLAGTLGMYTSNVANSRAVLESFAAYPRSYVRRMIVVYNGISWVSSEVTRAEARAKFDLPDSVPLVVNVGRLSEQKNQSLLLRALSEVPAAFLAIAGTGELLHPLQAEARELHLGDRVRFLGTLDRKDIPDLLQAADVFAQPSLFEGQSNALLEAMCAGLPVLVSDIAPQVETLAEDGQDAAGRILPVDDPKSWAGAIAELIRDDRLRQHLGLRARERAAAFTVERMGDGFENAIRGSLGLKKVNERNGVFR